MHRLGGFRILIALLTLDLPGVAYATGGSGLDPGAIGALKRMGAYLRSLPVFQIDAETTDEGVLDDGEKVQFSGYATVLVRAPDRLHAEVSDERNHWLLFYDGKDFTLLAGRHPGYYATLAAPSSITTLVDRLNDDYGFSGPLVELFRWVTKGTDSTALKRALDLGPGELAGVTCEHYAIRQDDVDWQVWIQQGDYPLPRKLVITERANEAKPQYTAVFNWNLAPSFDDLSFKFAPPSDAQHVILKANAARAPVARTRTSHRSH
jgi:hypothetical protein